MRRGERREEVVPSSRYMYYSSSTASVTVGYDSSARAVDLASSAARRRTYLGHNAKLIKVQRTAAVFVVRIEETPHLIALRRDAQFR